MASGTGQNNNNPTRISPRKFSEKIALLNKKEREANAKFEEIIKEVQATRSCQPQQLAIDSTNKPTPQCITDELQSMIESTRYKAAHSDSLEEIEKVYDHLMKCVAQCDYPDAASNQRVVEANRHYSQQQFINCARGEYDEFNVAKARTNNPKGSATISTTTTRTTSSMIPATTLFYSQQSDNGFQCATTIDLNNNQQQRQVSQNINCIPCETITNENHLSGHEPLNVCVSSTYLPQVNQESCIADSQTRARVVSFGSASRQRHRYGLSAGASDYQSNQGQASLACDYVHPYQLSQCHNQYLKEPSGDRSRQKSSSDPQLHVVAPAGQYSGPADPYKSDHRLAMIPQTADSAQMGSESYCHTGPQHQLQKSQNYPDHQYKLKYFLNKTNPQDLQATQHSHKQQQQQNRVLMANSNLKCDQDQVSTTSQMDFQNQFNACDAGDAHGKLPGIKICAIEDTDHLYPRPQNQRDIQNRNDPSSCDSSLPDISNLQFNTHSAGGSPERHVYHQTTQGDDYCSTRHNHLRTNISDSCQALDGSWASYGSACGTEIDMEVQTSDNGAPISDQNRIEQLNSSCFLDSNTPHPRQQQQQRPQPLQQTTLKTGNQLSNSDCGFDTSHGTHHQQGNLMICTSSDLYNNISRSRSHSSIDYLAKQNSAKRANLYADNNLQQFDEHHTSQYCLQNDHQLVMNVRRVAELKAQGTSTSPLNSSSNLNSPQSEINSPGSSTTEQCEPAMIFPSTTTTQQEYYPVEAAGIVASDSDESRYVSYLPGSTMIDNIAQQQQQQQQQQQRQTTCDSDALFNSSNQCIRIIQQAPIRESFMGQSAPQASAHLCQPSTGPSSQGSYNGAISPSSSTNDSMTYINNSNNDDNSQQLE